MVNVHIKSIDQIGKMIDMLHDYNLDLESLVHHSQERTLSISFYLERPEYKEEVRRGFFITRIKVPIVEHILTIYNVVDYKIMDTEKIRFYPFNTFEYSGEIKKLVINTSIPLTFDIIINDLNMTLVESKKIVDWKNHTIFSCLR